MREWKNWRSLLGVLLAGLVLSACGTLDFGANGKGAAPPPKPTEDIQERLSAVIGRNGFTHSLRSHRAAGRHNDIVYISIPLDSLKRRHFSLENLLEDVGRVCTMPEYADLPIRIEFAAGDDADRRYLQDLFLKHVGHRANITVTVESDFFDDILIMTSHPEIKAR